MKGLYAKYYLAFYVFINCQFCQKYSYLGYNLLYLSKKCPKTNLLNSDPLKVNN